MKNDEKWVWGGLDRTEWSDGPWNREPDRVEFRHAGFPCLMRRNSQGIWCGYVGVPPGHPWFGVKSIDQEGDVHGGVTYAEACDGDQLWGICHVPQPGEPDHVFWIGFDCGHWADFVPGYQRYNAEIDKRMLAFGAEFHRRYRNINFVRGEVRSLADQAAVAVK